MVLNRRGREVTVTVSASDMNSSRVYAKRSFNFFYDLKDFKVNSEVVPVTWGVPQGPMLNSVIFLIHR